MSSARSGIVRLLPSGVRRSLRRWRGRWRTRPSQLRAIRAEFAAMGEPLEVIGASGREVELDGGERSPAADLAMSLLRARPDGARLLSAEEWADLATIGVDGSNAWPDTVRMLHRFTAARDALPMETEPSETVRRRVVVDVRPLQSTVVNGTVTHARNVIDTVLRSLPAATSVEAFVDTGRPLPDEATMSRFAVTFDPSTIDEVAVFIEPSPLESKVEAFDLDVRPGITRVGVWLDAIIGAHPEHFLPLSAQVFGYQYSLECVGVLDRVLALSESSRDEAIALGIDPSRIVVTSCRSSFQGTEPSSDPLPFDRFVLLSANTAPHKDLVTALVAVLPTLVRDDALGVVVIASPSDEERDAIGRVLERAGIDRRRCAIESQVSTARMVQVFAAAEVVVVSSQHEGFSLPIVEAIILGTPVVASNIAAHRELLGAGAWMFEPGDPVECSRALRWVQRDRAAAMDAQRSALAARYEAERLDRVVGEVLAGVVHAAVR